jgi:hypothetical protein
MFVVLLRSVYSVHNTEHIGVKRYKLDLKEVFGTIHETVVGRMLFMSVTGKPPRNIWLLWFQNSLDYFTVKI